MSENKRPEGLQEAVERSYRAQWGGRRFYLVTSIVLFVIAVTGAAALVVLRRWPELTGHGLKAAEISALAISFICLVFAVLSALESVLRWQREQGQFPDRAIHNALCFSAVTVASLLFLLVVPWEGGTNESSLIRIAKFVVFLFCGLTWLGSVVMDSAGFTLLVTRRSELIDVNNTETGTSLIFRKGHSTEIVKLAIAVVIPFVIFIVALLMASLYLV